MLVNVTVVLTTPSIRLYLVNNSIIALRTHFLAIYYLVLVINVRFNAIGFIIRSPFIIYIMNFDLFNSDSVGSKCVQGFETN